MIQLEVDSSVNSNHPENSKAEVKLLLERNKHLEKTLKQHLKKKWKTFTDCVDYGSSMKWTSLGQILNFSKK